MGFTLDFLNQAGYNARTKKVVYQSGASTAAGVFTEVFPCAYEMRASRFYFHYMGKPTTPLKERHPHMTPLSVQRSFTYSGGADNAQEYMIVPCHQDFGVALSLLEEQYKFERKIYGDDECFRIPTAENKKKKFPGGEALLDMIKGEVASPLKPIGPRDICCRAKGMVDGDWVLTLRLTLIYAPVMTTSTAVAPEAS